MPSSFLGDSKLSFMTAAGSLLRACDGVWVLALQVECLSTAVWAQNGSAGKTCTSSHWVCYIVAFAIPHWGDQLLTSCRMQRLVLHSRF